MDHTQPKPVGNLNDPGKQYTGSCYIGVVGGETENGECRDTIENLQRQPGDTRPISIRGTKGYEIRSLHIERWYEGTQHPFCLLLDHDHVFPPDTLTRLRSHKLPLVSGYYLRRRHSPIAPVWFEPFDGTWPLKPLTTDPERGRLHELGASGFGCLLIHRDVITALKPILKSEWPILEDDMDVWPYDLNAIMGAIKTLKMLGTLTIEKIQEQVEILEKEIRPLRSSKIPPIGADIRFSFYAREAGFVLWGDPDVRAAHMLNYPLHPDDWTGVVEGNEYGRIKGEILHLFWPEKRRMREQARIARGEAWQCGKCQLVNPITLAICEGCGDEK